MQKIKRKSSASLAQYFLGEMIKHRVADEDLLMSGIQLLSIFEPVLPDAAQRALAFDFAPYLIVKFRELQKK